MKKVFSLVLSFMLIIPAVLFCACSKGDNASAVKNKIYYVTKVTSKGEDVSKPYVDNNMKIIFYNNTFMVEYSNSSDKTNYGYYLGTFTTNEMEVIFTVTEAGGVYENYENKPEKEISVFKSLRYSKNKLYTEFAYNGAIYNFTLEQKSSK